MTNRCIAKSIKASRDLERSANKRVTRAARCPGRCEVGHLIEFKVDMLRSVFGLKTASVSCKSILQYKGDPL